MSGSEPKHLNPDEAGTESHEAQSAFVGGGRSQPYLSASLFADANRGVTRTSVAPGCGQSHGSEASPAPSPSSSSSCAERGSACGVRHHGRETPWEPGTGASRRRGPEGEALGTMAAGRRPFMTTRADPDARCDRRRLDRRVGSPRRLRRTRDLERRADRRPGHSQRRQPESDGPRVRTPALGPP